MGFGQGLGKIVSNNVIRGESGNLISFDPNVIVKGQGMVNDEVAYEINGRTITKLWLLKDLDGSDSNNSGKSSSNQFAGSMSHVYMPSNHIAGSVSSVHTPSNQIVGQVSHPSRIPSIYDDNMQKAQPVPRPRPRPRPQPSMEEEPTPQVPPRPLMSLSNLIPHPTSVQKQNTSQVAQITRAKVNALFNLPSPTPAADEIPPGVTRRDSSSSINSNSSGADFKENKSGKGKNNRNNKNNNKNQNNNNKKENNNDNINNNKKELKRQLMYEGIVTNVIRKEGKSSFGFIKCDELRSPQAVEEGSEQKGNVFFPFENVQSNLLDVRKGDHVEFRIYTTNKNDHNKGHKAASVKVLRLEKRPFPAIREYLQMVKDMLKPNEYNDSDNEPDNDSYCYMSDSADDYLFGYTHRRCDEKDKKKPLKRKEEHNSSEIVKVMSHPVLWQSVAEQVSSFNNAGDLVELLLEVIILLNKSIRTLEERFRQVLVSVTSCSKFFNPVKGKLLRHIRESSNDATTVALYQEFLLLVGRLVPEKRPVIIASIKPLMDHPTPETAVFLYQMLKTLSTGSAESIDDLDWRDLPLILKKEEIFNSDLNNKINLKPVQSQGSYESPEDYIDIYFRLLREDCFSNLRKCIRQLLDRTLDFRDMNVYNKVALVGISLKDNALYMAFRIVPLKEVKDWETNSSLMFGSLLCISIGGGFDRPIWVTVASRDMLKKDNIVIVQTCWEWNDDNDAEIMLNMITAKGDVWMVESPTYYRAFQPVLQTLQKLDSKSLCFKDELVDLTPGPMPYFLPESASFDSSIVHKNPVGATITLNEFFNTPYSKMNSLFDESQEDAVKNALQNRIGIIQGPPGCGKSFIGVKMLQLLLSLSTLDKPKVLVLTYKNHALDEFLKGIMKYVDKSDVVRIGGRFKDAELDQISLNTCKRNSQKAPELRVQIGALYAEMDEYKEQVHEEFRNLNKLRKFNYDMFLEHLSKEQVESLLLDCNWDQINVSLNFGGDVDVDADGFGKQKRKGGGGKNTRMTNKIVVEIMNSSKWEKYSESFRRLKKEALKRWMPSLKQFEEVESNLIGTKTKLVSLKVPTVKDKKKNQQQQNEDDEKGLYEIEDKQEIEEVQQERMSAITKTDFTVKSDFQKTLVKVDYTEEAVDEKEHSIKAFSASALRKLEDMNAGVVLMITKMWDMDTNERIQFTQSIVNRETKDVRENFQSQLKEYEDVCKQKSEMENQHVASILKEKQIIGVTITGASINQMLLKEIQPEIVIVEEAAEVLEPQLLACIGTWTKYMLLIGDHQQLRPSVDSYELRRDFNFDLSMMERLINNNMSYNTLKMQNRQRPEFAELLFDIYPGLQTNAERVKNNEPAKCLQTSSFFWHHTEPENKERSVTNPEEAKRAVKLALFLVQQGYQPSKITILATYRGQTALIRRTLKEYERHLAQFVQKQNQLQQIKPMVTVVLDKNKEEAVKETIKIHTVDMYQGDENDFVIVSLVRSNKAGKIGFLSEKNRRCVAQSRARCGVYFIGNADMFLNNRTWTYLVSSLKNKGRLGCDIGLVCERHPTVKFPVRDSSQLTLESFCKIDCAMIMRCGVHPCRKKCQPPHSHNPCPEKVQFKHLTCGHDDFKKCEVDADKLKCKTKVKFQHSACGHAAEKKCCEDVSTIICSTMEMLKLKCGHTCMKMCFQNADDVQCKENCVQIRKCGHACRGHKCFQHASGKECPDCLEIQKAKQEAERLKEQQMRDENAAHVKAQIVKLQEEAMLQKGVEYVQLLAENDTHTEYLDVVDRVKKYIQPGHNWYPRVERTEKVVNRELRIKFLDRSTKLNDPEPRVSLKFYRKRDERDDLKEITRNGFQVKRGEHGVGVYMTTDYFESDDVQDKGGPRTLLLCEVYLGYSFEVKEGHFVNAKQLRDYGSDCLFAPRRKNVTDNTGGEAGDGSDEYVVFNTNQVYPKYLVHYTAEKLNAAEMPLDIAFASTFRDCKKTMQSKRGVDINNPAEAHFASVEARFLRMLNRNGMQGKHEITEIDIYINPQLEAKFKMKHAQFKQRYGGGVESEAVYGFHGTKSHDVVDSIMNDNFRPSTRGKFGAGVYFSEHPDYTFGYGGMHHLIMAKILPGSTKECRSSGMGSCGCTSGYDSHGGFKQADGTYKEVVIFNMDQILPCYVIHFK